MTRNVTDREREMLPDLGPEGMIMGPEAAREWCNLVEECRRLRSDLTFLRCVFLAWLAVSSLIHCVGFMIP